MATLHVRQFPDSLHRRLSRLAERDRRSLGAEVVVLLEREIQRSLKPQRDVLKALGRWRFRPAGRKVPSSMDLLRADRRR